MTLNTINGVPRSALGARAYYYYLYMPFHAKWWAMGDELMGEDRNIEQWANTRDGECPFVVAELEQHESG